MSGMCWHWIKTEEIVMNQKLGKATYDIYSRMKEMHIKQIITFIDVNLFLF